MAHRLICTPTCALVLACVVVSSETPRRLEAQVIHDGSLGGVAGALPGPNYAIDSARGALVNNRNLFHSFSRFNISAGEIATFQSPASVRNILARVTGGTPSQINGTLRSPTAGANLFLINPSGVVFGSSSKLQVNGAFVVTTADVVNLGDGGRFSGNFPATDNLLSAADPVAFGFLTSPPGRVSFTGSAGQRALLNVSPGNSISVISGKVRMEQARLKAPSGAVNIVALQSAGNVTINPAIEVDAERQDAIELERGAEINVDGAPGGGIVLKGGKIVLAKTKAQITAQTFGAEDGRGVDIRAIHDFILLGKSNVIAQAHGAGNGGDIKITAHRVTLDGLGAADSVFGIVGGTDGAGRGADVAVKADSLVIRDSTKIAVESLGGGGAAGAIGIRVRQFLADATNDPNVGSSFTGLLARSKASGAQNRAGRAGNVDVRAESITVRNTARISADSQGAGPAGSVVLQADDITLAGQRNTSFSSITATTGANTNSQAGRIDIRANDTLTIADGSLVRVTSTGQSSPGQISISAGEMRISDGARVESGSEGTQRGSALNVNVRRLIISDGGFIKASASNIGNGGVMSIVARDNITLDGGDVAAMADDGSLPPFTGILAETTSQAPSAGFAGMISLDARSVIIRDGARISVGSKGAGDAGNVNLKIDGPLRITQRSRGTAGVPQPTIAGIFADSESAGTTAGSGGKIAIIARDVTIDGPGAIAANVAGGGTGGDVQISAEDMRLSRGAQIAAASRSDSVGGPSGDVRIKLRGELEADDALVTVSSRTLRVQAGDIDIKTGGNVRLTGSRVSVTSRGTGGNITLTSPHSARVTLDASQITARTSGSGASSQIIIDPKVVSLGGRSIIDGTANGQDVRVQIVARGLIKSTDSRILTDRRQFTIDDQLASSIISLNFNVNDVAARLQPLCLPETVGDLSSFLSLGRGGVAPDPQRAAPSHDIGTER